MILIDLNQVFISSIMYQTGGNPNPLDENLVRHMALNIIRSIVSKNNSFGEVVICCDNRYYWRKRVFPYYQAHRKKEQATSSVDWSHIYSIMDTIRGELKEYLPYRVLDVHEAEADDIIAVLTERFHKEQKILIVSTDKDFLQLQAYENVYQYSNIEKKFLTTEDPKLYLAEHILRGDKSDGIPNFQSDSDTFVKENGRQRPLNTKKVEAWIHCQPEEFCDSSTLIGWKRNQMLIDLKMIPDSVRYSINSAYDTVKVGSKNKMLTYFIEKKLTNLTASLSDF